MQRDLLLVNEIFQTLQGEAGFTGTPSVFVRLQGCPVGCAWCDTRHTWHADPANIIPINRMLGKDKDTGEYAEMSADAVIGSVTSFDARHVVITGGEPCLYDLVPLSAALVDRGYSVQVETSGTAEISVHPDAWVTVSPKLNMPGGLAVREDALRRANEIKMPIGKPDDIELLEERVVPFVDRSKVDIWLQPLSQSRSATALCVETAGKRQFRVSIQTHKYIGIR